MPSSSGVAEVAPLGQESDPNPPRGAQWDPTCYGQCIPERLRNLKTAIEEYWMEATCQASTGWRAGATEATPATLPSLTIFRPSST